MPERGHFDIFLGLGPIESGRCHFLLGFGRFKAAACKALWGLVLFEAATFHAHWGLGLGPVKSSHFEDTLGLGLLALGCGRVASTCFHPTLALARVFSKCPLSALCRTFATREPPTFNPLLTFSRFKDAPCRLTSRLGPVKSGHLLIHSGAGQSKASTLPCGLDQLMVAELRTLYLNGPGNL